MQYIVTMETNWYTANGNVGNSPSKKLQYGYIFDSVRELNNRRQVSTNLAMWIPSGACIEYIPPDVEPDPDPTEPPATIINIRESFDGGLTYNAGKYYEEIP